MDIKTINGIKLGVKKSLTRFDLNYPVAQVAWLGKLGDVIMLQPYGRRSQAPINSLVLLFNILGDEANRIGIEFDPVSMPPDKMFSGEYEIGNYITTATIRFNETGGIDIKSMTDINMTVRSAGSVNIVVSEGDVNVTATNINLNGKVNLGSGGPAIARVGDSVVGGVITTGSGNHTAS